MISERSVRLELGDKTEIVGGSAGYAGGQLWLYLPNFTLQQAAEYAFDQNKMNRIDAIYGSMHLAYEGFTVEAILKGDNEIKIRLAGGHVAEERAEDEGHSSEHGSDGLSDGV